MRTLRFLLFAVGFLCSNWTFAQTCESGYQPYDGRCISNKMSDLVACLQNSGKNIQRVHDLILSAKTEDKGGAGGVQGKGPVVSGGVNLKLDAKTEQTIIRDIDTTYFPGALEQCNIAVSKSDSAPVLVPHVRTLPGSAPTLFFDNTGGEFFARTVDVIGRASIGVGCPPYNLSIWYPFKPGPYGWSNDKRVFAEYSVSNVNDSLEIFAKNIALELNVRRSCVDVKAETYIRLGYNTASAPGNARYYEIDLIPGITPLDSHVVESTPTDWTSAQRDFDREKAAAFHTNFDASYVARKFRH